MGKLEVKIDYDRQNISETAKKEVGGFETYKWAFDCVTFEQKAILDAEKKDCLKKEKKEIKKQKKIEDNIKLNYLKKKSYLKNKKEKKL